MKTIGMLGGMSFESTLEYYRLINEEVKRRLGGSHSAKIAMISFDYHVLERLLEKGDWDQIADLLSQEGRHLKDMGADMLVICANTMHVIADRVEKACDLPLIHIVKATLSEAKKRHLTKVALLGTMYTMESPLYPSIFKEDGIEVILPDKRDMAMIHRTIYTELILGTLKDESREKFLEVIFKLREKGAQGVILGCTEIPLLIHEKHLPGFPVLNTMKLHAFAAVDAAIEHESL